MIAVQGIYDNGRIQLSENAPVEKANVIVVFPEAEKIEKRQMSVETARKLFDEFTGSIDRDIDERAERLGALDEKYAGIN